MRTLYFFTIALFVLSSCKTLIPFSKELKENNRWQDADIKNIQFYTSETIVLKRELRSNETGIVSGKIKMVDGKEIEEIIIQRNTPGVVVALPDNNLAISFEINDNYYLVFGIDPKRSNRYYLRLRKEYNNINGAQVTYNDKAYQLSRSSLNSFLMVNLKKINKQQRKLRVAKGRKL